MKKFTCVLLLVLLALLPLAGCDAEPSEAQNGTDIVRPGDGSNPETEIQAGTPARYFMDIYRCDDVYRTEDTPTHGSGTVTLSSPEEPLSVTDVKIIACADGCRREDVVSRAAQGYAKVADVVETGFFQGEYAVYRYGFSLSAAGAEDMKNQGTYEEYMTFLSGKYFYLFILDDIHYAYISVERKNGETPVENEAFLADTVANSVSVEWYPGVAEALPKDTITDIAEWDLLPWVQEPYKEMKRAPNAYNFIYELVSGNSRIPEYNGLGITDYSITLLENPRNEATFRFTFTVTGNSLPETLPPGTYTKTVYNGIDVFLYDGEKPKESSDYIARDNALSGMDRFGDVPAAVAVHQYLSWTHYAWEVAPFGQWDPAQYKIPYNYVCAFYGNENISIPFTELQTKMKEKFGITVERPEKSGILPGANCAYNKDTDRVGYADTRGYEAVHRIIGVRTEGDVTVVTVQLYADRLYLIPAHKVEYRIGEGDVFLGCEVVETTEYEPFSIQLGEAAMGLEKYILRVDLNWDNREYLSPLAVYGEIQPYVMPDRYEPEIWATEEDGEGFVTFGVGSDYTGTYSRYITYRVQVKDGKIFSVREVPTMTKVTVAGGAEGIVYSGPLEGRYTGVAYGRTRTVDIKGNQITVYSYQTGTDAGGIYTGEYVYHPDTGYFWANLSFSYHDGNGGRVTMPAEPIEGRLYEYGGFIHFACRSNPGKHTTVNNTQALPLTFVRVDTLKEENAVLAGEETMYTNEGMRKVYLNEYLSESGLSIRQRAFLDVNGDSDLEAVLWLAKGENEDYGFLVLHGYGIVYAHFFWYRAFSDLKADGTFRFSSGVSDHGIGRLSLTGPLCTVEKLAYCQAEGEGVICFVGEESVTKEVFDAYEKMQTEKPDATWEE